MPTCMGQVGKREKRMKKKLVLMALLVAVVAVVAFAASVRYTHTNDGIISINSVDHSPLTQKVTVKYTARVDVKNMTVKLQTQGSALFNSTFSSKEKSLKKGKTYTATFTTNISAKNLDSVKIWLEDVDR